MQTQEELERMADVLSQEHGGNVRHKPLTELWNGFKRLIYTHAHTQNQDPQIQVQFTFLKMWKLLHA